MWRRNCDGGLREKVVVGRVEGERVGKRKDGGTKSVDK